MAGEKTESVLSKVIIGVLIAVLPTIILVHLGYNKGEDKTNTEKVENTNTFKPLVSGTYFGSCQNTTVGGRGNLVLNLDQQSSGKVTGSLNISGELSGSGNLEGYINENKVSFISKEQSSDISISWEGLIQGNNISGNYTVSMPTFLKAQGAIDQKGAWEVAK